MTPAGFYLYRVQGDEGPRDFVSLVPPPTAAGAGVPAEAIIGRCLRAVETGEGLSPENFHPNPLFVNVLHYVIGSHGPALPGLREEARRQGTGWLYLIDARTPTPDDGVPPHDIIGAFQVERGEIVPHSWQPNPNHVLVSEHGLFRLTPQLHERLIERVVTQAPEV